MRGLACLGVLGSGRGLLGAGARGLAHSDAKRVIGAVLVWFSQRTALFHAGRPIDPNVPGGASGGGSGVGGMATRPMPGRSYGAATGNAYGIAPYGTCAAGLLTDLPWASYGAWGFMFPVCPTQVRRGFACKGTWHCKERV